MKKREISFAVALVVILVLGIILAFRSCSGKTERPEETEMPTETVEVTVATEVATEPTEVVPEPTATEVTEPEEVKTVATQPVTTSKPNNSVTTSNSSNTGSTGTTSASSDNGNSSASGGQTGNTTTTVTPAPTPTGPVPAETKPPVVEPAPTEHTHNWQEVYHEEVSHDVWWVTCKCGAKFTSNIEWIAHSQSYDTVTQVLEHGGYGEMCETIVDTPAYSTWVCACGATSDTQP